MSRARNSCNKSRGNCSGGGKGMRTAKIELPAEVAGILESYMQRRKTAPALALRARIVLGCAVGLSNKAVAARARVAAQTVGKWRLRFVEHGLDGLLEFQRRFVGWEAASRLDYFAQTAMRAFYRIFCVYYLADSRWKCKQAARRIPRPVAKPGRSPGSACAIGPQKPGIQLPPFRGFRPR